MRISDWSSDVCSSDLRDRHRPALIERREAQKDDDQRQGIDHWCLAAAQAFLVRQAGPFQASARRQLAVHLGDGVHRVASAQALARRTLQLHGGLRSEEHTSELQSLMRISYSLFCLIKNTST